MPIQNDNRFDEKLNDKLYYYYSNINLYSNELNEIIDCNNEIIQQVTFGCGEGNGTNIRRLAVIDAVAKNFHTFYSKLGVL